MKICQLHWEQLRKAIADRGLEHLGAKNGADAMKNLITEIEGREAENDFDPLMAAHNMIWSKGLEFCGLTLMANKEDGSHPCPICLSVALFEQDWINGPADCVLAIAKEENLI